MSAQFSFVFVILFGINQVLVAQSPIPAFQFLDLNGETFTQSNLPEDQPVFIMRFDPYCEHCDTQAQWIAEAEEQFKDIHLVFVSFLDEVDAIQDFQTRHFSDTQLEHLHFLRDPDYQFEEYFGYTDESLVIYLYQPGKKSLKYFGKEQAAEILLKFL
ncbi:MAG: redoxin domain-containing protein [Bacteroidota bacterium]